MFVDDNRSMLAVELDPRIHFALNCGATSCPPIRVYSSANLDYQLDRAAASFLCSDGGKSNYYQKKLDNSFSNVFFPNNFQILIMFHHGKGTDRNQL